MLDIFEDYLFSCGCFVASDEVTSAPAAPAAPPAPAPAAPPAPAPAAPPAPAPAAPPASPAPAAPAAPPAPAPAPPAPAPAPAPAAPAPDDPAPAPTAAAGGEHPVEVLVSLARMFGIRITSHPERAQRHMIEVAARNLGWNVPQAFYRGFPQTVRDLTPGELLVDQLLHYARTYGMGDFGAPGHSAFEAAYARTAFAESVEPKRFAIIDAPEAEARLARMADGFLSSTRPLNETRYNLLRAYVQTHAAPIDCASKDTACRLLADTRDARLARLIELPDVIRVLEWMLVERYPGETLRLFSLRNQDRKLLCAVLDALLADDDEAAAQAAPPAGDKTAGPAVLPAGDKTAVPAAPPVPADIVSCMEKRRTWKGLLHHLHYKPTTDRGRALCAAVRGGDVRSAYGDVEARLRDGDVRGATDMLRAAKGPGAVLRSLTRLLSCCTSQDDVSHVLASIDTRNKVLLIQLLLSYGLELRYATPAQPAVPVPAAQPAAPVPAPRTFVFTRLGMLARHTETPLEVSRRKTVISDELRQRARDCLHERLQSACRGTLGAVYASEDMRRTALPLRESTSMGGFGTLPSGTRIPLPAGKVVRAFTYWAGADDVDLSGFGLGRGGHVEELSWRTMWNGQSTGVVFSGDQTSGWNGGSEYFDVDLPEFRAQHPAVEVLVFCNNLYSGGYGPDRAAGTPATSAPAASTPTAAREVETFAEFDCRAGFMLRSEPNSGEVFEPKTVQTSFAITCASRAAFLFAIDLTRDEFVWLNLAERSNRIVAGTASVAFVEPYLRATEVMSLYDYARMLATRVVDAPELADVIFSDDDALDLRPGQEQIRSRDVARLLELL